MTYDISERTCYILQMGDCVQVDHAETEDGEAASGQKANVIEALQTEMSSVTVSAALSFV